MTIERITPRENDRRLIFLRHMAAYKYAAQYVHAATVLDCGCGTGYGAAYMKEAGAKHVVGIDKSACAVNHATLRYCSAGLSFLWRNIVNFKGSRFDVVTCFQVIEHLEDTASCLRAIRRALKPGGIALFTTPNKPVYNPDGLRDNPFHVHEFEGEELESLLLRHFDSVHLMGITPNAPTAASLTKAHKSWRRRAEVYAKKTRTMKMLRPVLPKWFRHILTYQKINVFGDGYEVTGSRNCLDLLAICYKEKE